MKKLIHKIVVKIKAFFIKRSARFKYEQCYYKRETDGVACFKMCGGMMGGDRYTDELSYKCVSCPYLNIGWRKGDFQND